MRVEPIGVGSIAHIVKRGARGLEIVRDSYDRDRLVSSLYYLNESYLDENWTRAITPLTPFERPAYWPDREPLAHVLAWTLMPNHFHLLLREIREGGITKFMQRLCGSMSAAYNSKYKESGSLFQGAYKSRSIQEDSHLRYLAFYIQVKNVLELYPGGLVKALKEFDKAWDWSVSYPYSSLQAYAQHASSPIIEDPLLTEMFPDHRAFKMEAREMLLTHVLAHDKYASMMLEPW